MVVLQLQLIRIYRMLRFSIRGFKRAVSYLQQNELNSSDVQLVTEIFDTAVVKDLVNWILCFKFISLSRDFGLAKGD